MKEASAINAIAACVLSFIAIPVAIWQRSSQDTATLAIVLVVLSLIAFGLSMVFTMFGSGRLIWTDMLIVGAFVTVAMLIAGDDAFVKAMAGLGIWMVVVALLRGVWVGIRKRRTGA